MQGYPTFDLVISSEEVLLLRSRY